MRRTGNWRGRADQALGRLPARSAEEFEPPPTVEAIPPKREWYYTKDGRTRVGPVATDQLRTLAESRALLPTDMVMREGMRRWLPAAKIKGLFPGGTAPAAVPPPLLVREAVAERREKPLAGHHTGWPSTPPGSEASDPWLPPGQDATLKLALASGQIARAKPVKGWKKPSVEIITKAMFDLEELFATVSPLLRHHPAGANCFSDELWRILGALGRLKMTLSSPDLPE
jgi:hypothetical protein